MRRLLVVGAALFVVLAGAFVTSAAQGGNDRYSFTGGSGDGGSCGNTWAQDSYTLDITVRQTAAGVYSVKTMYKNGSFVTNAGDSPGKCSSVPNHGSTLTAGIAGSMSGWLNQTITSATYDPNGCSTASLCTTRTDALNHLFPGGSSSDFSWNFEYNSNSKLLKYKHWQDNSDQSGNDSFNGDIANS